MWPLLVILLILWLIGYSTALVGDLIHLLLIVALIVIAYQVISGRMVD